MKKEEQVVKMRSAIGSMKLAVQELQGFGWDIMIERIENDIVMLEDEIAFLIGG